MRKTLPIFPASCLPPHPSPNHQDLLKILELLYKTPLQEVELLFIFEYHIHNHCICVYV